MGLVAHGLWNPSLAQESNLCPLHWQGTPIHSATRKYLCSFSNFIKWWVKKVCMWDFSCFFLMIRGKLFKKFILFWSTILKLVNNVFQVHTTHWLVIHVHVSILFKVLFPFRLLQNDRVPCACWLSVLNMVVCTCQSQTPQCISGASSFPLVTIHSFSMSVSLFMLCK